MILIRMLYGKGDQRNFFFREMKNKYPSLTLDSKDVLEEGMVFTTEPGLYFPWGGARIEDTVLLTEKGCRPLTSFSVP